MHDAGFQHVHQQHASKQDQCLHQVNEDQRAAYGERTVSMAPTTRTNEPRNAKKPIPFPAATSICTRTKLVGVFQPALSAPPAEARAPRGKQHTFQPQRCPPSMSMKIKAKILSMVPASKCSVVFPTTNAGS